MNNVLKKKIDDLHHSSDILETQRRKVESQMLKISQNIAVAREKINKMNDADKDLNHGLGHLPVMIGRSLDKIPGGAGIMALPKEYQEAVVHKSKLIAMENQSKSALRAHKHRVEIDQRLWLLRQNKNEEVIDVERRATEGFLRGKAEISGLADDTGKHFTVHFQNEFSVGFLNGEPIVMTPDLICLVDSLSGDGIGTDVLRYGQRIAVLALPGPEIFRTKAGLEAVGPRAFGFDLDYHCVFDEV